MSITRRSFFHTLSTLPLAFSLGGCRKGEVSTPKVAAQPPVPSPKSIFVVFAGPWLIYQSDEANKTLTALTVDDSMAGHRCVVQKFLNGAVDSAATYPDLLSDTVGANIKTSSAAMADDFVTAFASPFSYDSFTWVRYTDGLDKPVIKRVDDKERIVTLPLPTGVYVGGFLQHAIVSENIPKTLKNGDAQAHVVTIFEYAPSNGKPVSLDLTLPGGANPYTFKAGDHLVFVVQHEPCDDEVSHVKMTFDFLTRHFTENPLKPIAFSKNDTQYFTGDHTDGIGDAEMGLGYIPCPRNTDYANCAGSSIIVGPPS